MFSSPVLLVSKDAALIETVRAAVDLVSGCRCFTVPEIDQALEFLADSPSTLCIYHATTANSEPLDWLMKDLTATSRSVATLVISDDDRPDALLKYLKGGAAECLARSFDLPRLKFLIDSLTFRARFGQGNAFAPQTEGAAEAVDSPILPSESPNDLCGPPQLMQLVRKVARQDSTLLLTGETGVGKTRMARMIHSLSPRHKEPFLTVNCAALPESLLESELFGHSKGSFTGADAMRTGRFAAAGKGTLLLDEVDSLPLVLQKKLLRAVDERVFEPVGSNRTQPLEARLIVATNRNLQAEIAAGTFRADLYYRLNIIEIELPPLRQRRQSIPAIAESYLKECAARNGLPVPKISAEAWDALISFDWPGNIRELRNAIERALALCDNRAILPVDLPEAVQRSSRREATQLSGRVERRRATPGSPESSGRASEMLPILQPAADTGLLQRVAIHSDSSCVVALITDGEQPGQVAGQPLSPLAKARAEGEVGRIKHALARAGNNRTQASAELGISRVALYKKLRRYGLTGS